MISRFVLSQLIALVLFMTPVTAGAIIPENTNASADFLSLREALAQSIADYADAMGRVEVAIAVTDLQNGETISVRGHARHRTGCVINMFALLAAVGEFQAGKASPEGLSFSIKRGIGGSYPPEVRHFAEAIFGSDSAAILRAREMMAGWGMRASFFDHIPAFGGEDSPSNILTALETNDILTRLWRGQLFNPDWTTYAIGRLRDSEPQVNYILPRQLPPEATVGHKVGFYADSDGWVHNDAGIVSFVGADGAEKTYAITYFSQRATNRPAGHSLGAKLSREVWDWMTEKYGLSPGSKTPESTVAEP